MNQLGKLIGVLGPILLINPFKIILSARFSYGSFMFSSFA